MKISILASPAADAQAARAALVSVYGQVSPDIADVIVALGGDGFMLGQAADLDVPVYGMNRGTVGFLMNAFDPEDLPARIAAAREEVIHPLVLEARDVIGTRFRAHSINDVSLLRQGPQAANLGISVDGHERLDRLVCDGVLVATPAGSTAYNYSAYGPILPIGANVLALTPIAAFRPRRWRGAVLPEKALVSITVHDPEKRPVMANAGREVISDIAEAKITLDRGRAHRALFDPGHSLEERILDEQFQ